MKSWYIPTSSFSSPFFLMILFGFSKIKPSHPKRQQPFKKKKKDRNISIYIYMNIGKHMVKDVKPTWKRRDQEFQANMGTYHCIVDCISHAVVLLKTSRVQTKQSPKTKKILQIYLKLALLNNKNCCLDSVFATEMEGLACIMCHSSNSSKSSSRSILLDNKYHR